MVEIWNELKEFARNKIYVRCLLLVMLLTYISLLINPTVSIDDTAFYLYYEQGVSPAIGRWGLYLINKFFPLNYNPHFVEAVGLLVFCISVTLWSIAMKRVFRESVSPWAYAAFACVMISSPIMSEVIVWYLQDGIYCGYGMTALGVLFTMNALRKGNSLRQTGVNILLAAFLVAAALGFYEAFMIVYVIGVLAVFMAMRLLQRAEHSLRIRDWLLRGTLICLVAMILRSGITSFVIKFFRLENYTGVLTYRGLDVMFGSWLDGTRTWQDFVNVMKQFIVKYYINAVVYVPIRILVLAIILMVLVGIVWSIRRKDGWIITAVLGILLVPWLLPLLEGTVTFYRSSQYIPVVTAFAVLLMCWQFAQGKPISWCRGLGCFLLVVLVYNQSYEMNKWFYLDGVKYENDKRVMAEVAHELMENYDCSKPICVVGRYKTPKSLTTEAYCPDWSRKYSIVKTLVDMLDEDLFETYVTSQGYVFTETPILSFIEWGSMAFYGTDWQLMEFWKMHGYSFIEDGIQEHYVQAKEMMKDGPVWPQKGSIVEMDDHIIVNFGVSDDVSE